ncbi:MAG: thioredoxin family protein [Verrucomicrobia bacterium]|nr:thioredoxin family protein [Verrucomicrobiota bacterium]
MKQLLSCIFISAAFILLGSNFGQAEALDLGSKIPLAAIRMKNVDGKELSIDNIAGPKGTLIIFSCNHCPYVKAWQSRMVALANSYQKRGVGVLFINSDDPDANPEDSFTIMQERAKVNGYQFPYTVDAGSAVARAFGATHTPEVFLFDNGGRLVYHGAVDDDRDQKMVTKQYLRNALEALVEGKPIPVAETKAIGCGLNLYPKF